jgi:hypothetical protein
MRARILDREARLVGEFAEIDLVRVRGAGERTDVGAGAEYVLLGRADHHRAHLRVLEAQPGHRVGQFDVDPEIIGIELQLGPREEPSGGIDIEGQRRDGTVERQPPMAVAGGLGGAIDLHRQSVPGSGWHYTRFGPRASGPHAAGTAAVPMLAHG